MAGCPAFIRMDGKQVPTATRDVSGSGAPPSADCKVGDVPGRFGSWDGTGKLRERVPSGRLRVNWKAPLGTVKSPRWLLATADRIVVVGNRQWGLWARDGQHIGRGRYGAAPPVLALTARKLVCGGASGAIAVHDLADGEESAVVMPLRPSMVVRGIIPIRDRILVVSTQRQRSGRPKPAALVEVLRVRKFSDVDEFGVANRVENVAHLYRPLAESALVCVGARGFYIAVGDYVAETDFALALRRLVAGPRWPVRLCVDGSETVYLLVSTRGGGEVRKLTPGTELWTPVGSTIELEEQGALSLNVSADGDLIVATPTRLIAFDPNGRLRWSRERQSGKPTFWIADGTVLSVEERSVMAYDEGGVCRRLFRGEECLETPAIISNGQLIVASGIFLYCLGT